MNNTQILNTDIYDLKEEFGYAQCELWEKTGQDNLQLFG